jgi:hypothetical protein
MAGFGPRVSSGGSSPGVNIPVIPVGSTQVPGDTVTPDVGWQQYSEAVAVIPGSETTVLSYVVGVSPPRTHITRIEFGGGNVSTWYLYFNGTRVNQHIIYWSGKFDGSWNYENSGGGGFEVTPGTVIEVKVLHNRPDSADFFARIQGLFVN